ncbi:Glutathione peroxidase, partial [Globisporangium splendens]
MLSLLRTRVRTAAQCTSATGAQRAWITSSRVLWGEFSDVLRFETSQPRDQTLMPADFKRMAVLVVNTASKCGYTPQLKQLQELHERFEAKGLVVVAVPSNDFNNQEPGTDDEIVQTYTSKEFNVSFPIAKKAHVTGDNAHAFFERIVVEYSRSVAPTWNFDKFLVDHRGDLRAVFPHDTEPLVPQVLEAIEEVLQDLPQPGDADESDESDGEYGEDEEGDSDDEDEEDESSETPQKDAKAAPRPAS